MKSKVKGNLINGQTREYWVNAAKQFVWPIDFDMVHISVPESEIELAKDNLMVQHFTNNGWHIQSAISVDKTKPFVAPVSSHPIFIPVKKEVIIPETLYKLNQSFRIVSSDCELKITHIEKGKIHLKYTNRDKHDLLTSEENLTKSIKRGTFLQL